jgi:hypothetical protein
MILSCNTYQLTMRESLQQAILRHSKRVSGSSNVKFEPLEIMIYSGMFTDAGLTMAIAINAWEWRRSTIEGKGSIYTCVSTAYCLKYHYCAGITGLRTNIVFYTNTVIYLLTSNLTSSLISLSREQVSQYLRIQSVKINQCVELKWGVWHFNSDYMGHSSTFSAFSFVYRIVIQS